MNKYTVYKYTVHCVQCVRGGGVWGLGGGVWDIGGGGVWGHRRGGGLKQIKTPAAKSLYKSIFLDNDIWHSILSF